MSEAKFTKGEWRVQIEQPYPHTPSQILTVVTNDFDVVCVPHGIRNQHDATLIAAAPEMYAMLESLDVYDGSSGSVKLQNDIESLLAKARGE